MSKLTKPEVRAFIDAMGGPAALARDLGCGLTVVAYWKQKGTIPRWRWRDLETAAMLKGVTPPKAIAAHAQVAA